MTRWIAEHWTWFELLALAGAVGLALVLPAAALRLERRGARLLRAVLRRPWLCVLLPGLLPVSVRVLLLVTGAQGVPAPNVPDEFSYLLGADTFAHGRLANSPLPSWQHFEVPFVVQQPTYASMYPPAQALVLGAAQALTGEPWWGVCAGVGLFGMALGWMLRGWVPPGWALVGATLFAFRLAGFGYWMNSYWGGAVAAAAGALVLGAWPRLARRRVGSGVRLRDAVLLGVGLAVLANSRPFEGAVLGLAVGAFLLPAFLRMDARARLRLALPLALVLGLTAVGMGSYFAAVTGSPTEMPYTLHARTYGVQPNFVWQPPREPVVTQNPLLDGVFELWAERYRATRSLAGWAQASVAKLRHLAVFFLGLGFGLPLLLAPWLLRDRSRRAAWSVLLVVVLAMSLEVSFFPHYAAPVSALFALLAVQGLRHLRAARRHGGHVRGRTLVVGLVAALVLIVGGRLAVAARDLPVRFWSHPFDPWSQRAVPGFARQVVARDLLARGRHLVFLRYTAATHHRKWAWNSADLDGQGVVWALERGPAEDRELVRLLPGREVWLAWPDESPPRLERWTPGEG